jgi:monoamine oxidase
VGYYHVGGVAQAYGAMAPERRLERALLQGAKIHGDKYVSELAASFSVAWDRTPHIEGAWANPPWGTAGYDTLLKPAGRVYFAGDWLSREVAWQHGAFVSVVTALHKRVLSS